MHRTHFFDRTGIKVEEKDERETTHLWYGKGFSRADEKKTLSHWEGNVAIGFHFGSAEKYSGAAAGGGLLAAVS